MNVGIVGARTFNNMLIFYLETMDYIVKENTIITGDATGTDAMARSYCKANNIPIKVYSADWETYGKKAGPFRNQHIINDSDILIAFWDGKSPGTKNSIALANKKGIPVKVVSI